MGSVFSVQALLFAASCFLALCNQSTAAETTKPNIIFMMIDDVGFNDLGYLGCTTTSTPNIDSLIEDESLLLWYNYAFRLCSPSRAAFLSGRNPNSVGLQNLMFAVEYPVALTRQVSVLSEEFRANGYSTHIIGKWHMGFPSQEYTPIYRGFDSFSGFLSGMNGYYDHTFMQMLDGDNSTEWDTMSLYDYWTDDEIDSDTVKRGNDGEYAMWTESNSTLDLLEDLRTDDSDDPFFLYLSWQSAHTPNEAPSKYTDMYSNGTDSSSISDREYKQAQMTVLDEGMRDVVDYLKSNGMWDDTLIVFTSDNGGDYDRGDNSPLRQYKNTSFEGGIRVPGFVTGGYLAEDRRGVKMDQILVHMTDWYPTLLSAAGLEIGFHRSTKMYQTDELDTQFDDIPYGTVEIDGMDIWSAIQHGVYDGDMEYEQRELVLDLDSHVENCTFTSCGAMRKGNWKFLRGANEARPSATIGGMQWQKSYATCGNGLNADGSSDALGCSEYNGTYNSKVCAYTENGCLFNLAADPCEVTDLGDDYPEIREYFIGRLDYHTAHSPAALILAIDALNYEDYDPSSFCSSDEMGSGQFWCPIMSYDLVSFEEKLLQNFVELWAGQTVNDTTENQKAALLALEASGRGFPVRKDEELNAAETSLRWKGLFHGHGLSTSPLLRATNVIVVCFMLSMMGCVVAMLRCGWRSQKSLEAEYSPLLAL